MILMTLPEQLAPGARSTSGLMPCSVLHVSGINSLAGGSFAQNYDERVILCLFNMSVVFETRDTRASGRREEKVCKLGGTSPRPRQCAEQTSEGALRKVPEVEWAEMHSDLC